MLIPPARAALRILQNLHFFRQLSPVYNLVRKAVLLNDCICLFLTSSYITFSFFSGCTDKLSPYLEVALTMLPNKNVASSNN